MSEETKVCPMCGETILAVAIKCKHCGSMINNDINVNQPNHTSQAPTSEIVFAGFWGRLAAALVDGFVMYIFFIPIAVVIFFIGKALNISPSVNGIAFLYYVLFFGVSAFYFSILESGSKSATYGKRWLGLQVVGLDGNRISGGRAFARWFSHIFSYLTLYIGFLMQPFTAKKQALHDLMSGTIVVENKNGKSSSTAIIAVVGIFTMFTFIGILAAIAIPAYQDYITKAKAAKVAEQQRIEQAQADETHRIESAKLQAEEPKVAVANSYTEAELAQIASKTNETLPTMVDKETRLDNTVGFSNTFRYNYTLVNFSSTQVSEKSLKDTMEKTIINKACTTKEIIDDFLKYGVTVAYSYYGNDGKLIGTISISPSQCDSKKYIVM